MGPGVIGKNNAGTGLADSTVDIQRMRPIWQAEQIEAQSRGEPGTPFDVWMKASGGNSGAMPRVYLPKY